MRTIILTDEQMQEVYNALDDVEDGNFETEVEIELENDVMLIITATGWLETDGYVEDDYYCGYMNGTGAYVETYRNATVELTATIYDEDGDEIECVLDSQHEHDADRYLNTSR